MKLLLSQKNELFDEIQNSGFSPLQFLFHEGSPTIIQHISSNFYFQFKSNNHYFSHVEFSPGKQKISDERYCDSWAQGKNSFVSWLDYVKRETETEDKWQRLQQEVNSLDIVLPDDSSKFSANEYEILQGRFIILKQNIIALNLNPSQLNSINLKLDYLLSEAKQMNKFDWKSLFIGSIVSLIIALSITHEQGIALWGIIKQVFNNFLLH